MKPGTIIIAEDEPRQRDALARAVRAWGHRVIPVAGGLEAFETVRREAVDVVLADLRMPDLSGLELLRQVHELQPEVAVVVLTAYGSVSDAVEAMKLGAADFLAKPVDLDQLELVLRRALERNELLRENRRLRQRLEASTGSFLMIGRSLALQAVLARAARAAETDATALLRGESGTGKELLARSIHQLSPRAEGPFIAVNCAALPETMLESELFGHERGAFTGAVALHRGRIERAQGGTLFLDEIGDLPSAVQVKLLRFLQEHEYTRLGGESVLRADVRIITATHRDLETMLQAGTFREDLFYRLNVVSLLLPPLRERREDIPELVEQFLARFAKRYDRPVRKLSHEAMDALMKHPFPGNVRELENLIEQATVLADDELITLQDLPTVVARAGGMAEPALDLAGGSGTLAEWRERIEHRIVLTTLARHEGNQSRAARQLGITEGGLRYKLKKWGHSIDAAAPEGADPEADS